MDRAKQLEKWAKKAIGWKGPLKQQPIFEYRFTEEELEEYKQALTSNDIEEGVEIVEQLMVWNDEMNYYIPVMIDENGNKYSLSYQPTGSCFVSGFVQIE